MSCLVFNHLRSKVWLHCEQLVSICHGLVHLTTLPSSTYQSNIQCYLSMISLACLFSVSQALYLPVYPSPRIPLVSVAHDHNTFNASDLSFVLDSWSQHYSSFICTLVCCLLSGIKLKTDSLNESNHQRTDSNKSFSALT